MNKTPAPSQRPGPASINDYKGGIYKTIGVCFFDSNVEWRKAVLADATDAAQQTITGAQHQKTTGAQVDPSICYAAHSSSILCFCYCYYYLPLRVAFQHLWYCLHARFTITITPTRIHEQANPEIELLDGSVIPEKHGIDQTWTARIEAAIKEVHPMLSRTPSRK